MGKSRLIRMSLLGVLCMMLTSGKISDDVLDKKVNVLVSKMTLEEKVGQMTQIALDVIVKKKNTTDDLDSFSIDTLLMRKAIVDYHVGSILNTTNGCAHKPLVWNKVISQIQSMSLNQTRLKIPVIYGIDAIHGATYTDGATMFPQEITLAASFNVRNTYNMAKVSAYETRACGIPWNFSPVLDLGADPRFPRQWEGFGEDPYLVTVMGEQAIKGYEGVTDSIGYHTKLAACMKHFLGYSVPVSGKDRTPAIIPDNVLREYHLPPFKAAVEAGVETVMINSSLINGVPVHSNYAIITKLLKEELKFNGFVVTDWEDILNLNKRDRIAVTDKEAIKLAINAGIDMSMVPFKYEAFYTDLIALVKEGEVKESRIDDAVRRILKVKMKLDLWKTPVTKLTDYPDFGSKAHARLAYNAAADAITLLKNSNDILPLSKTSKILVVGPNANSMRSLNGGWTYSWQGDKVERFAKAYNTILEAIQLEAGDKNVQYVPGVSYVEGGKYYEEQENQFKNALEAARNVDAVVLCLGENSYAEKPGDLKDLTLSALQLKLAKELANTGKPVILVLNEGRPRCINEIEPLMQAVVQTYLPGNYGGDALSDILFGKVNPSGKLPYTYPSSSNSLVTYYHKNSEEHVAIDASYNYESEYKPQWVFGFGLSYTTFEYSNLNVSRQSFTGNELINISVDVRNSGKVKGKETVMLFTSDMFASISPDVKRLRRFDKVELIPGETRNVKYTISATDLAFVNAENKWITEPGDFKMIIGNLSKTVTYK